MTVAGNAGAADGYIRVSMPDGSRWDVSVAMLAHLRDERMRLSPGESLREFAADPDAMVEWATSSLPWAEAARYAVCVIAPPPRPSPYSEGWINGPHEVVR